MHTFCASDFGDNYDILASGHETFPIVVLTVQELIRVPHFSMNISVYVSQNDKQNVTSMRQSGWGVAFLFSPTVFFTLIGNRDKKISHAAHAPVNSVLNHVSRLLKSTTALIFHVRGRKQESATKASFLIVALILSPNIASVPSAKPSASKKSTKSIQRSDIYRLRPSHRIQRRTSKLVIGWLWSPKMVHFVIANRMFSRSSRNTADG